MAERATFIGFRHIHAAEISGGFFMGMSVMKLRAPAGCASICHDGQIIVVEADGTIDVTKTIAAALTAHGFVPCDEASRMPAEAAATKEVDIDALKRNDLFAFLRARGIKVALPITNKALRAAARKALTRAV